MLNLCAMKPASFPRALPRLHSTRNSNSIAIARAQTICQLLLTTFLGLPFRYSANLLQFRSPLSLIPCTIERFDNLGAYRSAPETGLLIPSGFASCLENVFNIPRQV